MNNLDIIIDNEFIIQENTLENEDIEYDTFYDEDDFYDYPLTDDYYE